MFLSIEKPGLLGATLESVENIESAIYIFRDRSIEEEHFAKFEISENSSRDSHLFEKREKIKLVFGAEEGKKD
jgi:hypothetical protein